MKYGVVNTDVDITFVWYAIETKVNMYLSNIRNTLSVFRIFLIIM